MENNNNGFWESINDGARQESSGRIGNSPITNSDNKHINYEILPIQELRIQGEKLGVLNFMDLNKQELIEQIRNIKSIKGL